MTQYMQSGTLQKCRTFARQVALANRRPLVLVLMAASAVLRTSSTVEAQMPAQTFEQLKAAVQVGMKVTVTDQSGAVVMGKLSSLSPASLAIDLGDRVLQFDEWNVARVQRRVPDPLTNGILIGAAIGVAPVVVIAIAEEAGGEACSGQCTGAVLIWGAIGAGIGAAVDAAVRENRTIYARRASAFSRPVLQLAPILGPGDRGVRFTVRLSMR